MGNKTIHTKQNFTSNFEHHVLSLFLVFLLIFVAPIGLFLIFKDKRHYCRLPFLLWINGGFAAVSAIFLLGIIMSGYSGITSIFYTIAALCITILAAVGEIFY